jgi:DNA-binding NtrC family response regulator
LPGSETILVVEDDPDVRVLLSTMLEALDYTVLTVEHAAPALALLQTRDDIAVLISDIVLPGGTSGRSLLETASRLHPAVRRIAISGYPDSIITREGALPTGTHLLRKPFDLSAAGVAVAEALADAAYAQAS